MRLSPRPPPPQDVPHGAVALTSSTDLLVLGGGIAGLTAALAAAERGLRVLVVHAPRAGEASRAAAGMLAPSVEGMPPDVLGIAVAARDLYPRFLADLRDRTGVDVALDRQGILELASSGIDLAARALRAGPRAEVLENRALMALEPAFATHAGAVLHPGDGAVDNVALMTALELAVGRESHIRRVEQSATAFEWNDRHASVQTHDGDTFHATTVLLATGAWAATLKGLPRALPVRPVVGQLLRLDDDSVHHVTYGGGGYLIPRDGGVVVGATSEDIGFETRTTESGRQELRSIAVRAAPALAFASVTAHWAGLRPITPDALPILGTDPDCPGLVYAVGFSRNGILLAPWAAEQLAAALTAERPPASLALFSATRFGTGSNLSGEL